MSEEIASKWNSRYSYSGEPLPAPARVLSGGIRWLPPAGAALDLACGRAANGHWLAQRGFLVSAWDISETVVSDILSRQPQLLHEVAVRDVIENPPEPRSFNVIVVSRFLHRALCPAIVDALKPGGLLLYQTFTHGLTNPDYLLEANELLSLFSELHVLEYHEPLPDESGKAEARLIARKRSR